MSDYSHPLWVINAHQVLLDHQCGTWLTPTSRLVGVCAWAGLGLAPQVPLRAGEVRFAPSLPVQVRVLRCAITRTAGVVLISISLSWAVKVASVLVGAGRTLIATSGAAHAVIGGELRPAVPAGPGRSDPEALC